VTDDDRRALRALTAAGLVFMAMLEPERWLHAQESVKQAAE
jgi:hypothetical protein